MTKEQYQLLLKRMSSYILLKFYTEPIFNENRGDFEVNFTGMGLPDCEQLIDFAKKNDLNFIFTPIGCKINVRFWTYKHNP